MVRKTPKNVEYRRKREGKTNYNQRIKLLLGKQTRFIVRKSLKHFILQFVNYEPAGDKIITTVHSKELVKYGWVYSTNNLPAAYLLGFLAGKTAKSKGIKSAILDLGLQDTKESLFAVLKGAVDAGIEIPYDEKIIPKVDRINGGHIIKYAESLSKDKELYQKKFSHLIKNKIEIKDITKIFNQVKEKIDKK